MTRIGIYGGTFSPPHNGHVAAAKAFMEQMWLDFLFVVPAAVPPHKEMECPVSAADRYRMTQLAFEGIEGVYVSDMEIKRGGKSYTVDTLRELSGEDRRLFLLCGTDMMLTLDEWHEAEEIFRLCYPVYVRREKDPLLDHVIIKKIAEYQEKYGKIVRKIQMEPFVTSSHEIRKKIEAGETVSDLIPPSVANYIFDNHLYGSKERS
ncbi:MAG: nicotinate-nucleotide adenylyltransferase [Clostridia bacterium]|nr:nicotinate-nucleotide adenylyltransferase [Clostridia bacterium]MBQ3640143.1 nicotinate-nucleotide adenylyltransferase [Clostridia bacterium]